MGTADLSQANVQAYHDGDQDVRVESVSEGFKAVQFEYGSNFCCSHCNCPVEPYPARSEHWIDRAIRWHQRAPKPAEKMQSPTSFTGQLADLGTKQVVREKPVEQKKAER
jgi:hypothetical protein